MEPRQEFEAYARPLTTRWNCALVSVQQFLREAEEGTQAMEYLLVIGATAVPCFAAILLLEDVLREYLEFETIVLTSPFF